MTTLKILIATPSSLVRARMAKLVEGAPGCEVIATCADLSDTFNKTELHEPEVVLIAEEFCRLEEFSVMTEVFNALGVQWFILDAAAAPPRAAAAPGLTSGETRISTSMTGTEIARLIRSTAGPARLDRIVPQAMPSVSPGAAALAPTSYDKIVVIGASTGGVDALITVLQSFPADCPPTAIVQHTGRGFSDSLVQLLARRCKPRVQGAVEGLPLESGTICIAGGTEGHLTLGSGSAPRCQIRPGPAVSGHVPSVDMLFRSALPFAPRVVGTILTGMGQDGAGGLLDLHRAGCTTIGQDEASSVVYGMPKAAWDRGAVQSQLPIHQIGPAILRAAAGTSSLQIDRHRAAR